MLPDIGWWEFLVFIIIAIVVVGPKDLPRMLRIMGQWVGKARALAREFQQSLEEMARESELEELRKEVEELKKNNPVSELKESVNNMIDPNEPFFPPQDDGEAIEETSTKSEQGETPSAEDAAPQKVSGQSTIN